MLSVTYFGSHNFIIWERSFSTANNGALEIIKTTPAESSFWFWTQSSVWFEILKHSVDRCRQRSRALVLILGAQCAARALLYIHRAGFIRRALDYAHNCISRYTRMTLSHDREEVIASRIARLLLCALLLICIMRVFLFAIKREAFYVFMRLTPTLMLGKYTWVLRNENNKFYLYMHMLIK
jgi:hypothetical protein